MDTFGETVHNQEMVLDSILSLFDPFGTSWGSSLNWSQSAALERIAENTRPGANMIDMGPVTRELQALGQDVHEVARAVDSMEKELGFRLDAQTDVLDKQLDVLQQIAETLRNPLSTRAAERVRVAIELLRHQRFERALAVADEAIEDDPNTYQAFIVAGWASFGLKELERARGYFREARQATSKSKDKANDHVYAAILAARLTFALDGPLAAHEELAAGLSSDVDPKYWNAYTYDEIVYYAAAGKTAKAVAQFKKWATRNMCFAALTDPILSQNREVVAGVLTTLTAIINRIQAFEELQRDETVYVQKLRTAASKHQINPDLVRDVYSVWNRFPAEDRLNSFYLSLFNDVFPFWSDQLEKTKVAIRHHPRIDRELAKEAALTKALEDEKKDPHVELLFRGRIDAIVKWETGFRRKYIYLVSDAAKPNVAVRKYRMTGEEFYEAQSSIVVKDQFRALSEPRLSPIVSARPKSQYPYHVISWPGVGDWPKPEAWPDDNQ